MSFAKILRKHIESAPAKRGPGSPPPKLTVLPAIDAACKESADVFSVENIKKILKELLVHAEADVFNRDVFFQQFFRLYDVVYAPEARAGASFHASSLESDCERRLHYELKGEKPSDRNKRIISPQLQRIFDTGTWWHTYIQLQLLKAGMLVRAEVPVVNEKLRINSRADGEVRIPGFRKHFLLEIKSMNSFGFGRLIHAKKEHIFQASIYGHELKLENILFIYVNKDTSELKEFFVPVDEKAIKTPYEKMRRILKSIEDEERPDRICPSKSSELAIACPYCTKCFKDA